MQRFAALALAVIPGVLAGQDDAAAHLWRVASSTIPTPTALVSGGTAAWWNPAQFDAGSLVALEFYQTPANIGASGFVAALRLRLHPRHRVGLSYGRMSIDDLVRTTLSPVATGTGIPYYSHVARLSWAGEVLQTTLGAALSYHQAGLDDLLSERFTFDLGLRRSFGDRLTLAATTHFLESFSSDAAQDIYAALQFRLWRGELWTGSGRTDVHARYGVGFGHGYELDHQIGAGMTIGEAFTADLLVVAEGGFGETHWRPVAGVQLRLGRYRVLFSGDAGPYDIGAGYRVGLEVRLGS